MKIENTVKVILTKDEKTNLNQAITILSNICDVYDEYCCKGCPLADICECETINIVDLLDESFNKIEVDYNGDR